MIAALCYFAWLGWVTAPAPLLLLNSRRMVSARGIPFHLFASAGWSTGIILLRIALMVLATWLGGVEGPRTEAACNAVRIANGVIVYSFALLLSTWYAMEALLGREISLPPLSSWARARANRFIGRDC